MSLVSQVAALATRVASEIKSVRAALSGKADLGGSNTFTQVQHLHGGADLAASTLYLQHGDSNHGVQFRSTVNGPRLWGYLGGELGTRQDTDVSETWALRWDATGAVNTRGILYENGVRAWSSTYTAPADARYVQKFQQTAGHQVFYDVLGFFEGSASNTNPIAITTNLTFGGHMVDLDIRISNLYGNVANYDGDLVGQLVLYAYADAGGYAYQPRWTATGEFKVTVRCARNSAGKLVLIFKPNYNWSYVRFDIPRVTIGNATVDPAVMNGWTWEYITEATIQSRYAAFSLVDASRSRQVIPELDAKANTTDVTTLLAGKVNTTDPRLTDSRTPVAHNHDAANIVSGALDYQRMPHSFRDTSYAGGVYNDANSCFQNGWFYLNSGATNAPIGGYYFHMLVENFDGGWVRQTASAINPPDWTSVGGTSHHLTFVRYYGGGTWGAWKKTQLTQSEQDGRYSQLAHVHDDRYYTETEMDSRLRRLRASFAITGGGDITYTSSHRLRWASRFILMPNSANSYSDIICPPAGTVLGALGSVGTEASGPLRPSNVNVDANGIYLDSWMGVYWRISTNSFYIGSYNTGTWTVDDDYILIAAQNADQQHVRMVNGLTVNSGQTVSALDPNPQYAKLTDARLTDARTPLAHNHDASNIVSGQFSYARMPEGFNSNASNVPGGDWNNAVNNGRYMYSDAANAPGAGWWIGDVTLHNQLWVTQEVWNFTGPRDGTMGRYRRQSFDNGGTRTWDPWVQVLDTVAILDSRYYTETEVNNLLGGKVGTGDSRLTDARTPLAHTHDASAVVSGALDYQRMPTTFRDASVNGGTQANANTCTANGWYYLLANATGAPDADNNYHLFVQNFDGTWILQTASVINPPDWAGSTALDQKTWVRYRGTAGRWGPWKRTQLTQGEQDARYVLASSLRAPFSVTSAIWPSDFNVGSTQFGNVGNTLTFTSGGTDDKFIFTFSAPGQITNNQNNTLATIQIDGLPVDDQVTTQQAGPFYTLNRTEIITGLAAGNHTIGIRAACTAGQTATFYGAKGRLTIARLR